MKITKGMTWPLLLLALASTFVFMAGLASMQHTCYSTGGFPGFRGITSSPTGAFGLSNATGGCYRALRFYWFTFAFVVVTLLGLLVTAITALGLHFSRPFWIGMLAVSTMLMMIASEAFLALTDLYEGALPGLWINRIRLTAAGAIISVAFLVLLMMALGTDWEHRRGHAHGDKPTTGVTTTTVPAGTNVNNVRMVDQV